MSRTHDDPVLALTAAAHAYGRTPALRGVDLSVGPGETVAVTGSSGAGKSTLLHVAAGLLRPDAGTVRLLGRDLAGLGEGERTRLRRSEVGLVLQFGQLVPDLTVLENVALPLLLEGVRPREARGRAAGWLERAGLDAERDARPGELSGGEAQRAAVARGLVTGPALVLADEPTGSMDTLGGERILELLLGAVRDEEAALVLVTHDNLVAARADREVRLRDGIVEARAVLR
jgi:putative ABC transport system ATP-binding protein